MSNPLESVPDAVRFLTTVFEPNDIVLYRPIETWTEGGKKQSRTLFRRTFHRAANQSTSEMTVEQLLRTSEEERANLFFGVCPRFGNQSRFDLAWQIRTVRLLWTDIDRVSVEAGLERIAASNLPPPSIVVGSGNGVHAYWLLDQPYLIDDVGEPPPVLTDWEESAGGRKKAHKYVLVNGEKLYRDQHRHLSRLSPKAEHIQNVLAGIAKLVGGDATTDVSRLLRLPGSLNRKNQRNNQAPVPTSLLKCDATLRYPLAVFEAFKVASTASEQSKKISSMPLKSARKVTATKADKLAELIAVCKIAPSGGRSEADFALCCYAAREGIDKRLIWEQVKDIGKFAEQGERYFETTWENAEYEARSETLERLEAKCQATARRENPSDCDRPIIRVDAATTPVGDTLTSVTNCLIDAKDCFARSGQLVVVHRDSIESILSSAELAGLLNQHTEFFYVEDKGGKFQPLSTSYGNTWLNQRVERARMPQINLFTRNPVFTKDWRMIAPGYDRDSGIYFAGDAVESLPGTEHLDVLLRDFCFKAPADRTNYLGMLLTIVLMPHFIGAKPAALFNGNQPGLGKSILAQLIAILRDGRTTETASYNPNDEEFEKRLGAIVRRGTTTVCIDNARGKGRNARIESQCLERCITDETLSFRLLGKSEEIRAENSHIFCVTANAPDVSSDLVTRSVVINLQYEGDPKRRKFGVADPEGYALQHRKELLGELLGLVQRWINACKPLADVHTRFNKRGWGNIVGGILAHADEPDFLSNAEEAAEQLDDTRREFTELVSVLSDHQQGIWTSTELVELCQSEGLLSADLGEGSARSLSTKMGTLAGRFIDEVFALPGRQVAFRRTSDRKGNLYKVALVSEIAEP